MERAKELLSAKEVARTFEIAKQFGGDETTRERCEDCEGSGKVCNLCGWWQEKCSCEWPETNESKFDPIVCDGCDGTGEKK